MQWKEVDSWKLSPIDRGYLALAATLVYERLGVISKELASARRAGLVIQIPDSVRNEALRRYGARAQIVFDRLDPRSTKAGQEGRTDQNWSSKVI